MPGGEKQTQIQEAKVDWHFMVTNPGGEDQGLHADHAKNHATQPF